MQVCLKEMAGMGLDIQAMAVHRVIDPIEHLVETFRIGPEEVMTVGEKRKANRLTRYWREEIVDYIRDLEMRNQAEIDDFRIKFKGIPLRSFLDVPFSRGIISAHSLRPNAFSEQDVGVLKQVAEIFSVGMDRLDDLERLELHQREMVRLERLGALGEISAGISHNLNNILTGVLGPATLLQRQLDDPKALLEVEEIYRSAIRARDLVSKLHHAVHQGEEETQAVDVAEIVTEVIGATRPKWKDESESRGLTISVVTDLEDLPPIEGTQGGLHSTLVNLIFNAVDALPEGGQIAIEGRAKEGFVVLCVKDTGVGMDEETRRRVFEPFFTTKAGVGTGLGLSTVNGTVTRWGGEVAVESEVGMGTRFVLKRPVSLEGVKEVEPEVDAGSCRKGRILVVEDDASVGEVLGRIVERAGHEVMLVKSGEAALEVFETGRFEAAIVDLGMPGMRGDEVVRRMRELDECLASVLITGWMLEEDDRRRGIFDFMLQKPLHDMDQVLSVVARAIELYDKRRRS